MSTYVGRLAPAPTGALHIGNARTFLVAWLRARLAEGRLILRLEDLDHPRIKPGTAGETYRDLAWLGLDWDAGPVASFPPFSGAAAPAGDPFVQSQRRERYREIIGRLRRQGKIYPCVCTRKDLDSFRSAPNAGEDLTERRYPGTCRDRFPDAEAAQAAAGGRDIGWRFRIGEGGETGFQDGFYGRRAGSLSEWSGDFLIARGERAGYQLAATIDDHDQGVTEVVRGADLLPSTERQLALYRELGFKPPDFFHVPLAAGPDGRRLAKRHGDARLSQLRLAGLGPERLLGWLAKSLGWRDRLGETTLAEIRESCDFARLPRRPAILQPADLAWLGLG